MAANGDRQRGFDAEALHSLVPRLAYDLIDRNGPTRAIHEQVEGTLVSADISGFTRLTEQLADRGREGAEIMTAAVNSCFHDLIAAAEFHGGDVLKFGGDAVLVFFTGDGHRMRAAAAGQQMQFALRRNTHARRHSLLMTVGVADGLFEAMVVGSERRDLLLCGPATTLTLQLEDGADKGEVVTTATVAAALGARERAGGVVVLDDREWLTPERPPAPVGIMGSFVPDALRAHWIDYADLGAEHRQAAIGFVSIGAVDEHINEHGGAATAVALSDFIDAVHVALDTTGGMILHSDMAMGGVKLLIGAGVPVAIDDPADALLHAALSIRSIETPFVVRQGLNIGTVFAGFLGAPHRRTLTVMSDAVNTAARMTGPAGPGQVVAVDTLVNRARGEVRGEALEPLHVKGKETVVQAHRVEQLAQSDRRTDIEVDFAGREDELRRLTDAIEQGTGATIVGPAGSGKSRLADEALTGEGTVESAAGRYMTATPYGAFWSGVRVLLGIDGQLGSTEVGAHLARWLEVNRPALAAYASLLAPVLGGEVAESETVAAIDAEFRRDVLHEVFTQLLDEHEPSVTAIVLEDTQWLDDASRELLDHLRSTADRFGWVVVQSLRATSDEEPASDVTIELGPLDPAAISSIIRQACDRQLLQHEIERLVERANGNPLFALELARSVGSPGEEIPGSIEEVVAARIDRLPAPERRSVRLASVLGARFRASSFAALVEASGYDVETDVATITDIFEADDDEGLIRFRQLLYQDVAYASLPFNRRKRLHRAVGEHLEATVGDLDAVAALLSHHFNAAGDRARTWTYSIQAAERAVRQNSPGDAITLFERALDLMPRGLDRADRSAVEERLGDALIAAGNLEQAHSAFHRSRRLADDPDRQRLLASRLADCRNRQGRYSDALRAYSRLLSDLEDNDELRSLALHGRGSVLYKLDRNEESREAGMAARAAARRAGARLLEGRALKLIASAGLPLRSPDQRTSADEALAIFREVGAASDEAEVLNNIGVAAHLDGQLADAANNYRQSLVLKDQLGDLAGAAMIRMNLAEVELDLERTDGVRPLLESCLLTFERSGFTVGAAYTQGLLGRYFSMTGDLPQARSLLEAASTLFLQLGAEGYAADMDLLLIEVSIEARELQEARRLMSLNRLRLERAVFDNSAAAKQRLDALAARISD